MSDTTALTELAEAGVAVTAPPHPATIIQTEVDGVTYLAAVTAEHGLQVEKIDLRDDTAARPVRITGTRAVADLPSFLAELDRQSLTEAGTLWGNPDRGQITAIYNDHDVTQAGNRDDQLHLKLTIDPDWKAWHELSGKYLKQGAFGDRVEELLHTIVSPDQAELLEVIDSIRASSKGEFESGIERSKGDLKLVYKTETVAKAGRTGQLEVPQTIQLELRPWEGHPQTYRVDAWFRLSVDEGNLSLAIKLKPTRQIVREAWTDLTTSVTAAVGKPVYAQP